MTSYVANHQKKQRIFEKRERELVHAIKNGYALDRIAAAAERVRTAKIAVFKCSFSRSGPVQPHQFKADELAKRNRHLEKWLSMSTDEIVASYAPAGNESAID